MICPATGVEMTIIRGISGKPGGKKTQTNISRDRVLSSRKYSKQELQNMSTEELQGLKNELLSEQPQKRTPSSREDCVTDEEMKERIIEELIYGQCTKEKISYLNNKSEAGILIKTILNTRNY